MAKCKLCKTLLRRRGSYCSNKCQATFEYQTFIRAWQQGKVDGGRGVYAKNLSGHVRRYMLEKYQSCSLCGWNLINPFTDRCPLEIDHIDGNSDNNSENNLRVLCPNCHSLTDSFKNLNKGKGRVWRRLKYLKQ